MRKALLITGVVVIMLGLIVVAFGGGVLTGRFVTQTRMTSEFTEVTEIISDISEPDADNGMDDEPTATAPPEATLPAQSSPGDQEFDYELLADVLRLLDDQFYGEIPDGKTLAYGAIRGMLMTLDDPYTSFIEPRVAAILNEDASGQFEGIGATVRMREDGYLEVVRPLPGQPAEQAGVQAGDLILSVSGQSIVGMGLYEAISFVRGPAGSEALLEIARPGESDPLYISVIRAAIELPIVEYEILDNDIGYLLLTEFDATATDRVEAALDALLDEDLKGLIFDLRDNPGGYLDQAIKVADVFLDEGVVAIKRDSTGDEELFYSRNGDLGEAIPMVVLINGGSASASEIVAGALQDRDRALLIGAQTLGKGSVQLPNNLSDGSQLRVTIARWYTPDEQNIHNDGLMPDIEVEFPRDTPVEEDPQRDRAIEYLRTGK